MESKKKTKKSKVRIYVEKGGLKEYSIHDTMTKRRSILKKLLHKTPYSTIIKRLNVLAIYNKNRFPKTTSKIKKDMAYLQKMVSLKPSIKKRSIKKRSIKKRPSKKRSLKKRLSKKRSLKKGGKVVDNFSCPRRRCMCCRGNMCGRTW